MRCLVWRMSEPIKAQAKGKVMEINVSKADRTLEVSFGQFTADVQDYVIRYGLTQILNDAHSIVKSTEDGASAKAWALATKKLDALKRGEVRSSATRAPTDPVKAEALRMAEGAIRAIKSSKDLTAKQVREKAMKYVDTFMERAREAVEFRASLEIDLAGEEPGEERAPGTPTFE